MCFARPKFEAPKPAQEVKTPEVSQLLKRPKTGAGMAGGTLLTSPSGVASSALNTGAPTLLGG